MRHYIIGKDKCLIHTDSLLLEGWEPCTDLKTLLSFANKAPKEITQQMRWKGAKFPADLMKLVLGTIRQFPHMETAYSLYYNLKENKWAVKCPKQYGAGASVHYEDDGADMPVGYGIVGSIHTHPEMGAFWSGTDMNDQKLKHGIHFVFGLHDGLVAHSKITIFTAYGSMFDQKWEDVAEPVDLSQVYEPVKEWVETIQKQELKPVAPAYSSYSCANGYYEWSGSGGWEDYPYLDTRHPVDTWRRPPVNNRPYMSRLRHPVPVHGKQPLTETVWRQQAPGTWYVDVKNTQIPVPSTATDATDILDTAEGRLKETALTDAIEYFLEHDREDVIMDVLPEYGFFVQDMETDLDIPDELEKLLSCWANNGFDDAEAVEMVLAPYGFKQEDPYLYDDLEEIDALKEIDGLEVGVKEKTPVQHKNEAPVKC